METKKKILLVDDDAFLVILMKAYFAHADFDATFLLAFDAESAITTADNEEPDLVIMDILLNGERNGIEAAEIIKARHENTAIVFITVCSDAETMSMAAKTKPLAYIAKPVCLKELLSLCRDYFDVNKAVQDNAEIKIIKGEQTRLCEKINIERYVQEQSDRI